MWLIDALHSFTDISSEAAKTHYLIHINGSGQCVYSVNDSSIMSGPALSV